MAFAGPIADQTAIRALNDRYADAVFRRHAADWGTNWAEDGRWDLMGTVVEGRTAIVALWTQAMAGYSFVAFFAQPGGIDVDGDTATGRIYTHEVLEAVDGTVARPIGRYLDRYVRRDGGWLFAERAYTMLHKD